MTQIDKLSQQLIPWPHQVIAVPDNRNTLCNLKHVRTEWPTTVDVNILNTLVLKSELVQLVLLSPASAELYNDLSSIISTQKCLETARQMQLIADSMLEYMRFREQASIAFSLGLLQRNNFSMVNILKSDSIRIIFEYV